MGLENPLHIALILFVVLLLFGAKRLPEMGKSLGSGLRGFKEAVSGEGPSESTTHPALSEAPAPVVATETHDAATTAPEPVAVGVGAPTAE